MPLPWQLGVLGYLCGLFAWVYPQPAGLAWLLLAAALARGRSLGLMALCFVLGLFIGAPSDNGKQDAWKGQFFVRGMVDEVRTSPGQRISVLARDVVDRETGARLDGRLLWTWETPPYIPRVGQEFDARLRIAELRGRSNFGLADSEDNWARRGVRHRAYSKDEADVTWGPVGFSARDRLLAHVGPLLPGGHGGAVIRALLFGDRFLLDTTFMDRVRRAGLSHSLALSGLHLSLVAGFGYGAAWILGWLAPGLLYHLPRQRLGLLLALPLVFFYLFLGGFTPSLLRAALMLGAVAVHLLRGSRSHPQDGLLAAVAILALFDPGCIHDLSLQLSVLAVGGIVLFMPQAAGIVAPLRENGPFGRVTHAVALMAAVTVCANLLLLPVLSLYFSEFSGHLWLNLFWLPVLSLSVLPLSFIGLVCSLAAPALASGVFFLAGLGAEVLASSLEFLDTAGWLNSTAVLRPSGSEVVGYWAVLLAGCVFAGAKRACGRVMAFLGIGLALMTMPSLWSELGRLREQVELTILDTGMSQALYVRGPTGATILVDGGGGWGSSYDPGRALVGPALAWNHPPRVEGVLLTHVDADHVRGLFYILDAFKVGWFGWSGLLDQTADSRRLTARLDRDAWPVRQLRAGERVVIEPGLWLEVLHPLPEERGISENETSLVLRLVWKGRGLALLPGDAEKRTLGRMLAGPERLDAEVLVLPHHGSASSLLPLFYRRVGAKWAVAACGPGNRFGFPHPSVVRACENAGSVVLTTAEHGSVRFLWRSGEDFVVHGARVGKLFPD